MAWQGKEQVRLRPCLFLFVSSSDTGNQASGCTWNCSSMGWEFRFCLIVTRPGSSRGAGCAAYRLFCHWLHATLQKPQDLQPPNIEPPKVLSPPAHSKSEPIGEQPKDDRSVPNHQSPSSDHGFTPLSRFPASTLPCLARHVRLSIGTRPARCSAST